MGTVENITKKYLGQKLRRSVWALALIGGALVTGRLYAQASSALELGSASEEPRKFSLDLAFDTSSNLNERSSADAAASSSLEVLAGYRFTRRWFTSASISGEKSWDHEREATLGDTQLRVNHGSFELGGHASTSVDLFMNLPTSKDSRERDSLITSFTLRPNLKFDLTHGFSLYYRLGMTRYIHSFTTATSGKSNARYGLSQRVDVEYSPEKHWALLVSGSYSNAWTYENSLNQNFRFLEELSYLVTDALSVSLGHRNEGSRLKADGQSSNIEVFNGRSSIVYTAMGYTF